MSAFVCPECGQSSDYDPWAEQASCRHCGFSPPEGGEMLGYLRQQDAGTEQGTLLESDASPDQRAGLIRFLPTSGRMFLNGLAWGLLVFALIMLLGSTTSISASFVRCLALSLPFLTSFAVWRWYAWRESSR